MKCTFITKQNIAFVFFTELAVSVAQLNFQGQSKSCFGTQILSFIKIVDP